MLPKTRTTSVPVARESNRLGIHLFCLIDALGWEYLQERQFLSDLLPYRRPLKTVLGFSSGAIPTILTGVPPSKNGHWNLFYYDPQGSPFWWLKYFSFLPDAVLNHRVTTKLLKELGRRVLGMGPLFDCCVSPRLLRWFNWVEKRNIYECGGITGARSIFDQLDERQVPHRVYSYHNLTDAGILEQARKDIRSGEATFFFLYLSEMDMFLHMNCAKPAEIDNKIAWYDSQLRGVLNVARLIDPEATLTIFSDHGMTPVHRHHDLMKEVEALSLEMPGDYLAVYDSTMARFWFFSDRARQAISECLKNSCCGRIVPEQELKDLGVFFADSRYGEMVFLLHPGWLLSRSDFNGPQWMPAGMHGYHPGDRFSDAIFLANEEPSAEVHTIADVYRCMYEAAFPKC
jgi:hypothetical protein